MKKDKAERPRVGIGVMIWKDGKILIGKRRVSHGKGEYAWPGGHLEYMESFEQCAKREVKEEADIEIENVRFVRLLNMKNYPPRHYVDIGLAADWKSGVPKVMETDKCESWDWYDPENLPAPLFAALPYYFEAVKTGKNYFDN